MSWACESTLRSTIIFERTHKQTEELVKCEIIPYILPSDEPVSVICAFLSLASRRKMLLDTGETSDDRETFLVVRIKPVPENEEC